MHIRPSSAPRPGGIHPGATEICNGEDDDCDTLVDDDDEGTVGGAVFYADNDGDGMGDPAAAVTACEAPSHTVEDGTDCDDTDPDVHPGAVETCGGVDDDCDGLVDAEDPDVRGLVTTWADADGDGWGDRAASTSACEPAPGTVDNAEDCDDTNAAVRPDAVEVCDEGAVDDDCDGLADDADPDVTGTSTWYADGDGDGFGDVATSTLACTAPAGTLADGTDCDDTRADVYPGATEVCGGADEDCDGLADDADPDVTGTSTWYADADGDGFGDAAAASLACTAPVGFLADGTDCDDTRADVYPGATEVCGGADEDCDGLADDADPDVTGTSTWYADADGDGFGDVATSTLACTAPAGFLADGTDCDDTRADVHPGAVEVCGGADDDCDGLTDDADPDVAGTSTWHADADGDGFGDVDWSILACSARSGVVTDGTDCNDTRADVYPGATEVCGGLDDDCDGLTDDADPDVAFTRPYHPDVDGDGYGDTSYILACKRPWGYRSDGTDCDDTRADVHPGAAESCDSVDADCDGRDCIYTAEVDCGDGVDEDEDGLLDCEDLDCEALAPCAESNCTDGLDDDGDSLVDCDDDECWGPACHPQGVFARITSGNVTVRRVTAERYLYSTHGNSIGPTYRVKVSSTEQTLSAQAHSVWGVVRTLDDPRLRWSTATGWNSCAFSVPTATFAGARWRSLDDGSIFPTASLQPSALATRTIHVEPGCHLAPSDDWILPASLFFPPTGPVAGTLSAWSTFIYDFHDLDDVFVRGQPSWYMGVASATSSHSTSTHYTHRNDPDPCTTSFFDCGSGAHNFVKRDQTTVSVVQTIPLIDGREVLAGATPSAPQLPYLDVADGGWESTTSGASIGAIAPAGDVDADGTSDLLLGVNCTSVFVASGLPEGTVNLDASSARLSGGCLGTGLAGGEDLDADFFTDLVVTDPNADTAVTDGGAAYLVAGPVTASLTLPGSSVILAGTATSGGLDQVVLLPDPLGDGTNGLALGADGASSGQGLVTVFNAAPSASALTSDGVSLWGASGADKAGSHLAQVGDTDGDGFLDLLVGASGIAAAYLVAGPVTADATLDTARARLDTGRSLSAVSDAGDVDLDGYADLLVGDRSSDAVWLVHGPVSGAVSLDTVAAARVAGPSGSAFGAAVDACDVNGDGVGDLVVGAPAGFASSGGAGTAWILEGPHAGTVTVQSTDTWLAGTFKYSEAGTAVACVGDLDADGRIDLAVSDPAIFDPDCGALCEFDATSSYETHYTTTALVLGARF